MTRIRSSEITPKHVYLNRRAFMKASAAGALTSDPTQASATSFWNDPATKAQRDARAQIAGYNSFLMTGVPRK